MAKTCTIAMNLSGVYEDLREARRYCWSDPDTVRKIVKPVLARMQAAQRMVPEKDARTLERLGLNIDVGLCFLISAPYVIQGYLDAAAFELNVISVRDEQGGSGG